MTHKIGDIQLMDCDCTEDTGCESDGYPHKCIAIESKPKQMGERWGMVTVYVWRCEWCSETQTVQEWQPDERQIRMEGF